MTTVYDMASGTEYQEEELSYAAPAAVRAPGSPPGNDDYRAELRLALVEATPRTSAASICPAGLDMKDLLDKIED